MKIAILTGAGISAESGLGTFRDENGLWTQYDLEDVATPEGFARDPALVHSFYNARRANCASASHNVAHEALARLEKSDHVVTLITQNIDDLHERGGSNDVIHMHGELMRALCANCDHRWDAPAEMQATDTCPSCTATATRPDVVWFGEIPYHMDAIMLAVSECDLFVAIGTSGDVYPAAGLVDMATQAGADTLEINLAPSSRANAFARSLIGPATTTVPQWVDEVLGQTR